MARSIVGRTWAANAFEARSSAEGSAEAWSRPPDENPDLEDGLAFNSILAYLDGVGAVRLLTAAEEKELAIAIEQGTIDMFAAMAAIPFARDHLLALPRRLAGGEVLPVHVATLEENAPDEMQPAIQAEVEALMGQVNAAATAWRRAHNKVPRRADEALGLALYAAYKRFRYGAGITALVVRSLLAQVQRVEAAERAPDAGDSPAFGTPTQDVLAGAENAAAWKSLGLAPGEIDAAVRAVLVARGRADAARDRMIRANLRLVVSIAKRYVSREVSLLDLVQDGNLGLMKAVSRFDWRFGHRFSTYGTWWIRQAVTRSVADHGRTIRLPMHWQECLSKTGKARARLHRELGRAPTDGEVAGASGCTIEQLKLAESANIRTLSTATPIGDEDGELIDILQDPNAVSPMQGTIQNERHVALRRLLAGLTPREESILRRRFGIGTDNEATLEEVGEDVGLTRERVRQIEQQAVARLRIAAQGRDLRMLLEDA